MFDVLKGLTILDLTRLLPGPMGTQMLADMGARVIKIEDPEGGDYMRWMPPVVAGMSARFHALNRGKESVALSLKHPEGREAFLRLAARADAVVESFRPGVMAKLGVGYEALRAANPKIVLVSVSGYGQDGPYAKRAGHDINYIALAGVLGVMGPAGTAPRAPGIQVADVAGGAYLTALAVTSAIWGRQATGAGRHVDLSMTEGAMGMLSMALTMDQMGDSGALHRGQDVLTGAAPCYDVYRTKDGKHLAVGALEPKFHEELFADLGLADHTADALGRGPGGDEARRKLGEVIASKTREEWEEFFASRDVCVEPLLEGREVYTHPLHRARQNFVEVPVGAAAEGDGIRQVRLPLRTAGEGPPVYGRAPRLGQHTRAVLSEAGYAGDEIERLAGAGALGLDGGG